MHSAKLWFAVLILPVFLSFSCSDKSNPAQPPAPSPVGNWSYTGLFDYNGANVALVALYAIASNNTYQATGHITNGTTTITVYQELGTWTFNGNTATLTPSSCMSYDSASQALTADQCQGTSNFVLSGDTTMTDGTITLKKQ